MLRQVSCIALLMVAGCASGPGTSEGRSTLETSWTFSDAYQQLADHAPGAKIFVADGFERPRGFSLDSRVNPTDVRAGAWDEGDQEMDGISSAWFFVIEDDGNYLEVIVQPERIDTQPALDDFSNHPFVEGIPRDPTELWATWQLRGDIQTCLGLGPDYWFGWQLTGPGATWSLYGRHDSGKTTTLGTGWLSFMDGETSGPGFSCPSIPAEGVLHDVPASNASRFVTTDELALEGHQTMHYIVESDHPRSVAGSIVMRLTNPLGETEEYSSPAATRLVREYHGNIVAGEWTLEVISSIGAAFDMQAGWCADGDRGQGNVACDLIDRPFGGSNSTWAIRI